MTLRYERALQKSSHVRRYHSGLRRTTATATSNDKSLNVIAIRTSVRILFTVVSRGIRSDMRNVTMLLYFTVTCLLLI